jgi:hypothetical protein
MIGRIEIPPAVLDHRFVLEALGCALVLQQSDDRKAGVVGTDNSRLCELYGWAPNVPAHRDNTGWMYALMLDDGVSRIHAMSDPGLSHAVSPSEKIEIRVTAGDVFRLCDFCEHWTEDVRARVAAFVGCFDEPDDERALAILRAGVAALARGEYYGAPRVRDGFRTLLPDECYAASDECTDAELMLLSDAKHAGRWIQTCGVCEAPAVRLDHYWPYHHEYNRCREHLIGRNARGDCLPKAGEIARPADMDPHGEAAQFDPKAPEHGLAGEGGLS